MSYLAWQLFIYISNLTAVSHGKCGNPAHSTYFPVWCRIKNCYHNTGHLPSRLTSHTRNGKENIIHVKFYEIIMKCLETSSKRGHGTFRMILCCKKVFEN